MDLVFVHGWGFNAEFWDSVLALISPASRPQRPHHIHNVDLGFFGPSRLTFEQIVPVCSGNAVLVGHSLGFLSGLAQTRAWKGLIGINTFPCFVDKPGAKGCVAPAVLRDLKRRLNQNPQNALLDFYKLIHASSYAPRLTDIDVWPLTKGLDLLASMDARSLLTNLSCPALFLASRNDPLVPALVSQSLERYGELKMLESDSHILPLYDPALCAEHIERYLRKNFVA